MCQELRRNSPSVADWRPTSSCMATTSAMASSSTARNWSAEMRPSACCSRAARSRGGRRRLPTWSARYGGVVRSTVTSLEPLQGRLILPARRTGTDATRAPYWSSSCVLLPQGGITWGGFGGGLEAVGELVERVGHIRDRPGDEAGQRSTQ